MSLDAIDLQTAFQLENTLPAIAAAWHLGIPSEQITAAVVALG
jgi:UDP-N-acetylmuramyl tripeptide synthase